ncbi:MAG: CopD family protein [Anaerolineae bacterium]|nr:CopD family protein [Anaerolineae bacterium]
MITDWTLALSFALHLLATVVWIGGLILATALVWPEVRAAISRNGENASLLDFLDRLRKRFNPIANLSLLLLIVTGLFQMDKSPHYDGLLVFQNDWSRAILVKHVAVLGMVGVGVLMQFGVIPALERATLLASRGKEQGTADLERLRRRERRLTALNATLGVLVLVCTAVATAA